MPIQAPQMDNSAELLLRLVAIIIMVVNAIIAAAGAALWRSFRSFKEDQKKSLRDFVELHVHEHERVADEMQLLFDREREDRDILKETTQRLTDHIGHCKDMREACPGRRS